MKITRIDPPDWYVGMKHTQLQLMIYGDGIANASVTIDYPGVSVTSVQRLESENYLFIYLDLKDAQPGIMPITFSPIKDGSLVHGGRTVKSRTVCYHLKKREKAGEERIGFSKTDVLYLLMPDRFAQGHEDNSNIKTHYPYSIDRKKHSIRHGGDLEGIRQHLDYFNDLGVTALWLTPVLENDSPEHRGYSTYHGYATTDYYRVDPRFGTNKEYRKLVKEAHKKGLKIVMDMIFNHCGLEHPWLSDLPSKDWIHPAGKQTSYKLTPTVDPYASDFDLSETVDGWFVPTMPDLNQNNPHLMAYLIQNSLWWIETMGIDGIRMDTYPYADAKAMAHWMEVINTEYPNFNVVGESWVCEPAFTAALQGGSRITPIPQNLGKSSTAASSPSFDTHLTTVMDFTFMDRMSFAKYEETDDWWNGLNRIYNTFVYDYLYPNPSSVMAFLDNHDTDRFLKNRTEAKDLSILKQALALLLTVNRIPQIYYGTEILMYGNKSKTDGNVRKDFPGGFPGDKHNAFTAEGRTKKQNEMYDWLRTLLHWRKDNDAIIKGTQKQYCPYKGVYVMTHKYSVPDSSAAKHVMLILNGTSEEAIFHANRYKEDIPNMDSTSSPTMDSTSSSTMDSASSPTIAKDVITGKEVDIHKNIILPPRATIILDLLSNS